MACATQHAFQSHHAAEVVIIYLSNASCNFMTFYELEKTAQRTNEDKHYVFGVQINISMCIERSDAVAISTFAIVGQRVNK